MKEFIKECTSGWKESRPGFVRAFCFWLVTSILTFFTSSWLYSVGLMILVNQYPAENSPRVIGTISMLAVIMILGWIGFFVADEEISNKKYK